jgi:hypothetical protein
MDKTYGDLVDELLESDEGVSLNSFSAVNGSLTDDLRLALKGILEGEDDSESGSLGISSYASLLKNVFGGIL